LKRLLVSGANGFIGRHVLAALNEDNDGYEVHGLSRSAPAEQEGIYWHQADLLSPSSDKIVRDIGATHLLHLAWETERPAYWTSEDNVLWIEASTRLLRSFQAAGGNSFVGVGTCSEYAPSSERCSELTTPIAPWSIYGASKAALALLAPPLLGPDITATWARLFYLYGPGEPEDRLVPRLLGAVASGEEIKVHVNHVRDYLHVSDVARALLVLLGARLQGAVNVGSGRGITTRELASAAAEAANGRVSLSQPDQEDSRFSSAPGYVVADCGRLSSAGWEPEVNLENGLHEMVELMGHSTTPRR
jgi:nucleoside-diphosphate-sugar epimerase